METKIRILVVDDLLESIVHEELTSRERAALTLKLIYSETKLFLPHFDVLADLDAAVGKFVIDIATNVHDAIELLEDSCQGTGVRYDVMLLDGDFDAVLDRAADIQNLVLEMAPKYIGPSQALPSETSIWRQRSKC